MYPLRAVKKILFITLSNLGDVILSLPSLDGLRECFPEAEVYCMVGPRVKDVFANNPAISKLIVYDKHAGWGKKLRLFFSLRAEHFDVVIDLRNSFYGILLPAQYKTSPLLRIPASILHMKDRNLYRLRKTLKRDTMAEPKTQSLYIPQEDKLYVESLLKECSISENDTVVLVNPATASEPKRWAPEQFGSLCAKLPADYKIILIGAAQYRGLTEIVGRYRSHNVFDLTGRTTLIHLAYLLKKVSLMVTCDTGTMHLASYCNTPTVALFGPTDEIRYGPWSQRKAVIKKDMACRPCLKAQCRHTHVDCIKSIEVQDVLRGIQRVLTRGVMAQVQAQRDAFKRILIIRTDRIGDVILSTPVIRAMRLAYPHAFISVMVSPYSLQIVEDNPFLDEAIVFDKGSAQKSWLSSLAFARCLKRKQFDLCLVLHPTIRVHLLVFLAGIKRRIGYDRKFGFLLTDRLAHTKQQGLRHEAEYNLDFVKYLGVESPSVEMYIPIKQESEQWVESYCRQESLGEKDKLVAIHPAASCPSKVWPCQRFSETADALIEKYGVKIIVVAGAKDVAGVEVMLKHMKNKAVNLAGKTSVSQLASLLKRCRLFISNDSGPVHIAAGVGTPVISIFGRNQPGLSPARWAPLGKQARVLHKQVGCVECLAHNCLREFTCLKEIAVRDVLEAVDSLKVL